jgi:hypothetical protein
MGTSAVILFYEQASSGVAKLHKVVFHTADGYPYGVGIKLAKFLKRYLAESNAPICMDNVIAEYEKYFREDLRQSLMKIMKYMPHATVECIEEEAATTGLYYYDDDEDIEAEFNVCLQSMTNLYKSG